MNSISSQISQGKVSGTSKITRDDSGGISKIELRLKGLYISNGRSERDPEAEGLIKKKLGKKSSHASHLVPDIFGIKIAKIGDGLACATSPEYNISKMGNIEKNVRKIVEAKKNLSFCAEVIAEFELMNSNEAFVEILTSQGAGQCLPNRTPEQILKRLNHVSKREPMARRVKSLEANYFYRDADGNKIDLVSEKLGRDFQFEFPDRKYTEASTSTGQFNRNAPLSTVDFDSDCESLGDFSPTDGKTPRTRILDLIDAKLASSGTNITNTNRKGLIVEISGCSPSHAGNVFVSRVRNLTDVYASKLADYFNLNKDGTARKLF